MCSSARVGVSEGLVACGSINFGRPGALLGSSVAFGSGCGEAFPGVDNYAAHHVLSWLVLFEKNGLRLLVNGFLAF